MPAIFELETFPDIPLWGQVLIAARMVRRGALAMLPGAPARIREVVTSACDAVERCAERGESRTPERRAFERAISLRDEHAPGYSAVCVSAWWMVDAARAAEAANDFPIDAVVTSSARGAVAALAQDPRVVALQVTVLFAGDLDLVRFACAECGVGKYSGLTAHVSSRLAPVHALTLVAPQRSGESAAG
jgi:hypothetical protein